MPSDKACVTRVRFGCVVSCSVTLTSGYISHFRGIFYFNVKKCLIVYCLICSWSWSWDTKYVVLQNMLHNYKVDVIYNMSHRICRSMTSDQNCVVSIVTERDAKRDNALVWDRHEKYSDLSCIKLRGINFLKLALPPNIRFEVIQPCGVFLQAKLQ